MNHFKYIFSFNHKRYKCNNYYASGGAIGGVTLAVYHTNNSRIFEFSTNE